MYIQHCSTQYTFVNVCCGAEQKLFSNVTCNHVKPSSHVSQLQKWDDLIFGSYTNSGFTPVPFLGKTLTGRACSSRVLIGGQPHAFIRTPQQVIRRQLSHAWKTFYCQSSNWLFSWSGGQLDCRHSPTCALKPEANQCGFPSASSTLE
ncbi:hypothetical protein O181_101631 [Austropuccinia psidii MF-1]|uniref:Uncharacterized protein n=1 Tax=Austropuccinia psidii MF-1 TaxID=1389203 RepID=A0A9Q3JHF9_9BASI|nr:hypothetical protein [Austropuccinia psidii MF-1]